MENKYTPEEVINHPNLSEDYKYEYFLNLAKQEFKVWRSNNIKSSNVRRMSYNDETLILTVQFNDRSIYTYYNIDFETYRKLNYGEYDPRTTGSNEYGSWEKNVRPSTGAGIWQALIDTGVRYERGGSLR